MEKLHFSREELTLLMGYMNVAVQSGKVALGDIILMAPLAVRINEALKSMPIEGEKVFTNEEKPKNN